MRLVIVGEGVLRAEAERILERRWRAVNWRGSPASAATFRKSCAALTASCCHRSAKGISNTILEAMACALPVVATRVGGNAELVEDEITGRMVPAADPVALMQAIMSYFENPALARQHGRAGRNRVEKSFSLDRMVDSYHELYLAELRASRRAAARSVSNLPSAES